MANKESADHGSSYHVPDSEDTKEKNHDVMASLQRLHFKMDQQEQRLKHMEKVLSEKPKESVVEIPPDMYEHDFKVIRSNVFLSRHATTWSKVWKVGQGRPQFEAGVRFYNSILWPHIAVCLKYSRSEGISVTEDQSKASVKVKVTAVSSRGKGWNMTWSKDVPKPGYFSQLMWVTDYLPLEKMEKNGLIENETLHLHFEFWVY
ncbi:uncharacterized protein LOC101856068 [Aplysia californica]|uniref:Uncharacterized protein LOC101856068 n=1 Tax=Aplysia californica TaxID=6500 RepID=A0ABM0K988_APLCA|nr:uncharacterized protein LOC101856068 [Aplysia californica]